MGDLHSDAIESIETAIAHLGDALAQLDRMPASDAAVVGYVAHAMNNYLSVADATLYLMAGAVEGHPNPELKGWIDGLRHLGTLMSHAVGRLFQTTAGPDLPLEFSHVDLVRLMTRACQYYRATAERKGLTIVLRPGVEVPLVWGDRVAVAVIADNLLSNAVKFSHPGGEIAVEILPGPGGVACRVCDQGPGLSATQQSRLFQPGRRVGPTPTGDEPSSGFGLAIVKELVERMAGRVWVESEPEHGSCFSFRLPYPPMDAARR